MSINSPLGRRSLAMQGQQPQQSQRVLSVPDESESEYEDFVPVNPKAQGMVPSQLSTQRQAQQRQQPQQQVGYNQNLHQPADFDDFKDMRQQHVEKSKKVSLDGRDRINYLIGIGRKTIDVPVGDVVFTLRTLKTREMRDALVAANDFETKTFEHYYNLRNYTMAFALTAVDNMSLDLVLGIKDLNPNNVIDYLLDEMDDVVLDYLYEKFLKLHNDQKNLFIIKTENELKEVTEDIKK